MSRTYSPRGSHAARAKW